MTSDRPTFRIVNLGCKVNQYESAYLRESLVKRGCVEAGRWDRADITVVNTCIVTQSASCQSRQAIRKAIRDNPEGRTAAVGCYAQVYPEELSRIDGVEYIVGNTMKGRLPDVLLSTSEKACLSSPLLNSFEDHMAFEFLPVKSFLGRSRANLKIQDGCESRCSYCIIPRARGPLRSLPPSKVIAAVHDLFSEGYREIALTGIHLGKYGLDLGKGAGLEELLRLIEDESIDLRIRLSSLDPNEMDADLIDLVSTMPWVCRHFHISLQSGDDSILRRMNRPYSSLVFRNLVKTIHEKIPQAAIGVDVMVGFPGETEETFNNTHFLIRDLPLSYLHVFPYSPRKGTAAARFPDQVDPHVIKKRAKILRHLGQEKKESFYRRSLGKVFNVIPVGWHSKESGLAKGLTDNYVPVIFPSSKEMGNKILTLHLEEMAAQGVRGRVLHSSS
jgi:threonylcarbamoyladenosine tRNA methylthiotransferase MtaB